jgi:hypothetical protein
MLTRSLSGEWIELAAAKGGPKFFGSIFRINWRGAIDFGLLSHIWLGNWSFLVVRSWMYHFFYVLLLAACVGLVTRFVFPRKQLPAGPDLLLLAGLNLSFLAALSYHTVRSFQVEGFSGTFGYYMFPIVVAEAILFVTGLRAIAPAALSPMVIPFVIGCYAALEFYAVNFVAIAYYTGFTISLPNGNLHALKLVQLQNGGLQLLITRLAQNKPSVITILWALFLAATIALIAISAKLALIRSKRRDDGQPQDMLDSTHRASLEPE